MPVILKKNYQESKEDIEVEVHRRLKRGETNSFIYIAPTKRKIRDLQREFLRMTPHGASPAPFLFTLETLTAQLHSLICPPRRYISGTVQAVLMNEAVHSSADSLKYFRFHGSAKRLPKGTLQRIIDVVNTFKEKGIYRSVLLSELETAENFEKPKLRDILTIYDAYENLLGDQYVDSAGLFKLVNEQWDEVRSPAQLKSYFGNINAIFVSGFDEFSDPELTVLFNLSNIKDVGTLVSFDYHLENDEVFGHLKENYRKFIDMGFTKITTTSESDRTFAQHITGHLFKYEDTARKFPCTQSVTLLAADDRKAEVELIARLIKRLVIEKPDRELNKICVSMYRPSMYTNLFREVFARYGIPANITDRYYLDQSPLAVSIISLLAVQRNNYRLNDIMRALSSPYLRFTDNGEPIDASNLYEVASMLRITVGWNSWCKCIEDRLKKISIGLADVEDDIEETQLHHEEQMLRKAYNDLKTLNKILKPFEERMTPPQFHERLTSLLDKSHIVEGILNGRAVLSDDEKLEKDSRAYQKFIQFLDEFLAVLAFEGKNNINENLSFYVDRLREAISQVRYNIRQKYGYGVSVTSFDETRGLHFDVMIIAGLIDGEFPPIYQPEIFFSSNRRAHKERYHLHENRYLFYQAITNFTEHLYLTFPKTDSEVDLVPSSFIDALTKITDLEDCRNKLPPELIDPIYSCDDLLKYLGQITSYNIDHPDSKDKLEIPDLNEELTAVLNHMHHAICVERGRMVGNPIPEFNGEIEKSVSENAKTVLQRFRDRIYSVTQLESYGRCPFQFFANRVLRLKVTKELEEGITPIEKGGILHDILFEFYIDRRNRSLAPLSQIDERQFQGALDDLLKIANQKLQELNITDIFWEIDKESIIGSKNRKGILRQFLELERKNNFEVQPKYFEVAFGSKSGTRKKADPSLTSEDPIIAGSVKLRGKVDRIDVGEKTFRIVDYKTGTQTASMDDIELGLSLQLQIYLYAVEHILSNRLGGTYNGAAGIYYMLNSQVEEKLGIGSAEHRGKAFEIAKKSSQLLDTDEKLHAIIRQAITFVNAYVDNITRGVFPVAPRKPEQVCTYCDYRTICRVQNTISSQPNSLL